MSKLIYYKSNLYDLIIKSDRGKLFKGHSFNLTSSNNEICLVNNYFGGTVVNHYEESFLMEILQKIIIAYLPGIFILSGLKQ